ncbi:carboxymuconolactone decarboxylase family protein [Marinibaculum pumilum]|uniref:Carboxymuconolactone decarboxylase family protein n=1 Tax=Marinibaculum pumilum TaxID=1766165 RepID=A0ABV7L8D5_9PROT
MTERLDAFAAAPEAIKPVVALETYLRGCGLDPALVHLVKLRASQINGCAYCIHMHAREARADGETAERLDLLPAWRESSLYTERERAALAWTEALTRLAETGAPDADYEAARSAFDEAELVKLTVLIGTINVWNRLAVGFRKAHPVDAARSAA